MARSAPRASTPCNNILHRISRTPDYDFDAQHTDLVLVEGFKHVPFPKIELHRPALGKPLLYPQDPTIVAIATDAPLAAVPVIPVLDLAASDEIGEFVLRYCGIESE